MTPIARISGKIIPKAAVVLTLISCAASADALQVATASGASITLYGTAQFDASWENHRGISTPGNLAYYADVGRTAQSGEWNITAMNSRLGVNLTGPDSGKAFKLGGKIEVDFGSTAAYVENQPVVRLRLGYGTLTFPSLGLSFLAGQAADVFSPLGAPTINTGGLWFGGNVGYRRPQFRVTETVPVGGAKIEVAGAVARSIGTAGYLGQADGGHDADIPVFEGRAAVGAPLWVGKQSATIGFSGHFGQEDVLLRDTSYKTLNSWSINVDLELPLASFLSLVGEADYGANLDAYMGGINQGFTKRAGATVNDSTATNVDGWGGWAALRLKVGSQLNFNLGFGVDSVHASKINANKPMRNTNAFVNTNYYLAPNSRIGLELERIETDYKAVQASQRLWRTQAVYAYSF